MPVAALQCVEPLATAIQVAALYQDGTLDKIYRGLRKQVSGASIHEVQDAVGHAVVATLAARPEDAPDDPANYLFKAAKRRLQQLIEKRAKLPSVEVDADVGPADRARPEDAVDCRDLFKFLKRLVSQWDDQRMRTIIDLVLDAALQGLAMNAQELADEAEAITGETFTARSVNDLRPRGLRRLHSELEQSLTRRT